MLHLLLLFLLVFNTSDWNITTRDWPTVDGQPTWPGPQNPGEAVNNEDQSECYFKGMYDRNLEKVPYPYEKDMAWWHVFAARLAFVLAFEVSKLIMLIPFT